MQELEILLNARQQREIFFTDLYKKAFPSVAAYISRMGGNFDEAKDIFHDALIIYYEKSQESSFELNSNEKAYLLGIVKNLWVKKYKDKKQYLSLDHPVLDVQKEKEETGNTSSQKLLNFMEQAGKKCMEILKAFYYDKLEASQIAVRFGYAGVRSATVQKFKCLEKVRDKVKEKSLDHEDFSE